MKAPGRKLTPEEEREIEERSAAMVERAGRYEHLIESAVAELNALRAQSDVANVALSHVLTILVCSELRASVLDCGPITWEAALRPVFPRGLVDDTKRDLQNLEES